MSRFEFKLPDIGEGVTEGEIVGWLVKIGDSLTEHQDMVEVMTDKATVTIGAPKDGKVVEIRGSEGDVVPVGAVLVVLDVGSGDGAAPPAPAAPKPAVAAPPAAVPAAAANGGMVASAVGDLKDVLPGLPAAPRITEDEHRTEKALASPATRKLARELGVELGRVQPTGEGGRITREDVEKKAKGGKSQQAEHALRPSPETPPMARPAPVLVEPGEQRLPIRGLRKRIFENMARATRTAAHFTYVDECDVTALRGMRERTKSQAEEEGVTVNYLPFIIKAVVASLRKHKTLNSLVDDASMEMVLRNTYDVGIAVATEAGLTVPVLRGADHLSIIEITREIDRLSTEARAGKTRREDLGGSSFTITSLGKQGGLFATPVVNYPEVAILGVHAIKKRPVVRGDQIVVGDVMLLSLSFDHRIIDGHVGAAFAQEVIRYLEAPERLLLEMR